MSTSYVSPYGSAPAAGTTYQSPYGSDLPENRKYKSPYASGVFADPTHKIGAPDQAFEEREAAARSAVGGAGKRAVAGALELLNRPTEAAYAKHAGRGYWDTMVHGEDSDQAAADAARAYADVGKTNIDPTTGKPVPLSWAGQAALDMVVNPLSLLGMPIKGMTTLARAGEQVEKYALPAAVKAGQAVAKVPGVGKPLTDAAARAHNFLGVHSEAKRALAAQHGPEWLQQYATARARKMAADAYNAAHPEAPAAPKIAPDILQKMQGREGPFEASPLTQVGRVPADVLTAGLFAVPFGHTANIGALSALADPLAGAIALGRGTVNNAAWLARKGETDAAREARLADAARHGAVGSHRTEEDNILTGALGKAATALSGAGPAGQALALIPKGLRALYRASGKTLWKFDDEVKAQRYQHLVDGGMDPDMAGLRVGGELVDYENKSPVARNIRPLAPFSTWRTKAPLAVARNAFENPGRVSFLSSAVPAAFGGKQGTSPEGKTYTSSLPMAEFNQLTSNPFAYAGTSAGPMPRVVQDIGNIIANKGIPPDTPRGRALMREMFKATYGIDPGTFLLNESPVVGQALQMIGKGMFNDDVAPPTQDDLLSLLRVRAVNP